VGAILGRNNLDIETTVNKGYLRDGGSILGRITLNLQKMNVQMIL
jgi:hypothetical protein